MKLIELHICECDYTPPNAQTYFEQYFINPNHIVMVKPIKSNYVGSVITFVVGDDFLKFWAKESISQIKNKLVES